MHHLKYTTLNNIKSYIKDHVVNIPFLIRHGNDLSMRLSLQERMQKIFTSMVNCSRKQLQTVFKKINCKGDKEPILWKRIIVKLKYLHKIYCII